MPGIFGYVKNSPDASSQLRAMATAMKLYDHFVEDDLFEDGSIAASRVHLGHIGEKTSPYNCGAVRLWIEGEAYNIKEVAAQLRLVEKGFAANMVEAYRAGKLDSYLNLLDGYFCAVLCDSRKKSVKLISDRYGMRMLYWYFKDGLFAWASEVKGILALESINKTIDASSPQCFLDLGYLMGEHTWFEHIKLITPTTVLDFDITSQTIEQHHYWKWSEIQPSHLTFDQAVDALGEHFLESVRRRFDPNGKIGVALSGGLDSRAILAAVDYLYPAYHGYAYTFGKPGCDDIKIAEQVATRANWKHRVFDFNESDWFEPRLEKIWNTDGMMDMMHMHGSEFLDDIALNMDVNLNGYAGDAIVGGSFLDRVPRNLRVTAENSKSFYKAYAKLALPDSDFYDIKHVEPNLYMNRVRRFTNMGTVNGLIKVDQRKPFFDNGIVELIFSLPDEYRLDNKLYAAMLLKFFPKYFEDIPWQKTGKPVGKGNVSLPMRAIKRIARIPIKLGLKDDKNNYTNYPMWIRSGIVREQIKSILGAPNNYVNNIFGGNQMEKYLVPHLASKQIDNSNEILRLVTMELYLKNAFLGAGANEDL